MKLASLLIPLCAIAAVACTGPTEPDPSREAAGDAPVAVDAGDAVEATTGDEVDEAKAAMPNADYRSRTRMEPGLEARSESARADLAERLGVDAGSIDVVQAQAVMWPNSGLGCPEPDTMYMDVLTPGVRILLRTGGKVYEYHGGRSSAPFLCEPPERIRKPLPPGSYDDGT